MGVEAAFVVTMVVAFIRKDSTHLYAAAVTGKILLRYFSFDCYTAFRGIHIL